MKHLLIDCTNKENMTVTSKTRRSLKPNQSGQSLTNQNKPNQTKKFVVLVFEVFILVTT